MNRHELIEQLIAEMVKETSSPSAHNCLCKDGVCADGHCVIHNKEAVKNIVEQGATRITAGVGVDKEGGVEPNLARMIDHTLLKPEATVDQVEQLCAEAKKFNFASVCINPSYVPLAAKMLKDTSVKVCTVIGFPLGATTSETKAAETEEVILSGATEVDMVINVGRLKSKDYAYVEHDIFAVVQASKKHGVLSKVIIETGLLSDEEKVIACMLAKRAGADFVKTSTGFSKGGATAGDIALMRYVVGSAMGVKASGGVRTREDALKLVHSGADRIGASASVAIASGTSSSGGGY